MHACLQTDKCRKAKSRIFSRNILILKSQRIKASHPQNYSILHAKYQNLAFQKDNKQHLQYSQTGNKNTAPPHTQLEGPVNIALKESSLHGKKPGLKEQHDKEKVNAEQKYQRT